MSHGFIANDNIVEFPVLYLSLYKKKSGTYMSQLLLLPVNLVVLLLPVNLNVLLLPIYLLLLSVNLSL